MGRFSAGMFVVTAMLVAPALAGAATINVSTTADEYGENPAACSLREAISSANNDVPFAGCAAGAGADTIVLPAGEYVVTRAGAGEDGNSTGDFDIGGPANLTIQPAGPNARVTVDGNQLDRVFDKMGVAETTIKSIRVRGGKLTDIEDGGGFRVSGGGAFLENVTVDGNTTAYQGGGIAAYSAVHLTNSTVSGNRAGGSGGGFYAPGGSLVQARSTTIVNNQADADGVGGGVGGGFSEVAAVSIGFFNVINAGNTAAPPVGGEHNDCSSGPFYFPRYSLQSQLFGPLNCLTGFDPGTNRVSFAPQVGPLGYHGGQTPTHPLLSGSVAIGNGGTEVPDNCPEADQNGRPRPSGSCDIGSVQYFDPPDPGLPGLKNPSKQIATFDGKRLHIRLKCPARFKPACRSTGVPVVKKGGKAMGAARKVVTRSNRWKRVTFPIKPAFRAKVQAMTKVNRKRLVVRQVIRSKRIGKRKAKKPQRVFHRYKVRTKL